MVEIRQMVSKVFSVNDYDLTGKCRKREIVDARRCYTTIMYKYFNLGWSFLGRELNKNHASIIHLVNSHDNLYKYNNDYRDKFDVCADMALILQEPFKISREKSLLIKKIESLERELKLSKLKLNEITEGKSPVLSN